MTCKHIHIVCVVTTYWNTLDSHARDRMTSQNTCDIVVDNWVHTRGRGTGCDMNPQYTHQDRLQYMYMYKNDIVFLHFINIHLEIMMITYLKI